jgi:hypothetical protein
MLLNLSVTQSATPGMPTLDKQIKNLEIQIKNLEIQLI